MIRRKLPAFNNVFAGATASVAIPLGMTYERILLKLGGTSLTKAHLTKIRLRANNKTVMEIDGTTLDKINSYKGLFAAANVLAVDFTELFARDRTGQSVGAIPTNIGIANLTLEVDIAGAANSPTLEGWTVESMPQALPADKAGVPIVMFHKLLPYTATFNASGKFEIPIPYGRNGTAVQRIFIQHTGQLTEVELRKNGIVVFENPTVIAEHEQKENKLVPQANIYVLDFIVDHNLTEYMDTSSANTLQLFCTLSAGDTLKYWIECIDRLENL